MSQGEKILLALLGVALVAVVVAHVKQNAPPLSDGSVDDLAAGVVSQTPPDINVSGPSYMVANMPYGYGPPVTMGLAAPVVTQGFQGQPTAGIGAS